MLHKTLFSRWVRITLGILFLVAAALPSRNAAAQDVSAYDVIDGVNALRASYGLAPYQVDGSLMAYSQQHSEYQAAIHTSTHTHKDGSLPWNNGMQENIAAGMPGYITVDFIVYTIWSDEIHMKTMVGYTSGFVGAGVATDNDTVYITLDVHPGNYAATVAPLQNTPRSGVAQPPSTPIPVVPLATMTPRSDGSIFHVVGYGQSLWSIALAYGVKIDQIRAWNNIPAGSTSIYAGQRLLVHLAGPVTPTLEVTPSMTPTATPLTILPSPTPTLLPTTLGSPIHTFAPATMTLISPAITLPSLSPTFMPTPQPASSTGMDSRRMIGMVLVVICAGGLLALFLPRAWSKK